MFFLLLLKADRIKTASIVDVQVAKTAPNINEVSSKADEDDKGANERFARADAGLYGG